MRGSLSADFAISIDTVKVKRSQKLKEIKNGENEQIRSSSAIRRCSVVSEIQHNNTVSQKNQDNIIKEES